MGATHNPTSINTFPTSDIPLDGAKMHHRYFFHNLSQHRLELRGGHKIVHKEDFFERIHRPSHWLHPCDALLQRWQELQNENIPMNCAMQSPGEHCNRSAKQNDERQEHTLHGWKFPFPKKYPHLLEKNNFLHPKK